MWAEGREITPFPKSSHVAIASDTPTTTDLPRVWTLHVFFSAGPQVSQASDGGTPRPETRAASVERSLSTVTTPQQLSGSCCLFAGLCRPRLFGRFDGLSRVDGCIERRVPRSYCSSSWNVHGRGHSPFSGLPSGNLRDAAVGIDRQRAFGARCASPLFLPAFRHFRVML